MKHETDLESGRGLSSRLVEMNIDEIKEMALDWHDELEKLRYRDESRMLPDSFYPDEDESERLRSEVVSFCGILIKDMSPHDLQTTIQWLSKEHEQLKDENDRMRKRLF